MKKSKFEKNKFEFTLLYIIVPTQQRSNKGQLSKAFILFYNELAYVGTLQQCCWRFLRSNRKKNFVKNGRDLFQQVPTEKQCSNSNLYI